MAEKTIIVTGASRGLGAAAAKIAASLGAKVTLTARSEEALEAVAAGIRAAGGEALVVAGEVSDPAACAEIVRRTVAQFGGIDGLINNAGILEPITPVAAAEIETWERNWAVNVLGPVLLTAAALPHLRERQGRVINVSSGAAVRAIPGWGAYCVAKAAINHYTQMLQVEEPAVTSIAVRPGVVDTAMQQMIRDKGMAGMTTEGHARFIQLREAGELLPPEKPGRALALMALYAPLEWSGEFIQWDDERVEGLG